MLPEDVQGLLMVCDEFTDVVSKLHSGGHPFELADVFQKQIHHMSSTWHPSDVGEPEQTA